MITEIIIASIFMGILLLILIAAIIFKIVLCYTQRTITDDKVYNNEDN